MQLTPIDSSLIHAVGYDDEAGEMEVVFNNGGTYRYEDVDRDVFENLLDSKSKGQFMRAHVMGSYFYRKAPQP